MGKFTKLPDLLSPYEYYKLIREDCGYTAGVLADEMQITPNEIRSYECGTHPPSEHMWERWRTALVALCVTRRTAINRHLERIQTKEKA